MTKIICLYIRRIRLRVLSICRMLTVLYYLCQFVYCPVAGLLTFLCCRRSFEPSKETPRVVKLRFNRRFLRSPGRRAVVFVKELMVFVEFTQTIL